VEAVAILMHIVEVAHTTEQRGGILLEAVLSPEDVVRLCLWGADCEDCESNYDAESSDVGEWPEDPPLERWTL